MNPKRLGLMALTLCLSISGCSSVLTSTRNSPIEDDRGTRTIGSKKNRRRRDLLEAQRLVGRTLDAVVAGLAVVFNVTGRDFELVAGDRHRLLADLD